MRQPALLVGALFVFVAIIFGGGGSPAPISELIVQLASLAAAVSAIFVGFDHRGDPARIDKTWLGIMAAFVAIPILQLIPLPPTIWHALPGRDTEAAALSLVGRENGWMPISTQPQRTFTALLSLIPPMVMWWITARLSLSNRTRLLAVLVLGGLLTLIVGSGQLIGGSSSWLDFYGQHIIAFLRGFQANRNATADLLLIAMVALAAFAKLKGLHRASPGMRVLLLGLYVMLGLGVVLTGSRAGIALLVVALCATFITFRPVVRPWKAAAAAGLLLALCAGLAVIAAQGNTRIERVVDRFTSDEGRSRPELWRDTMFIVDRYWPVGSGVGTFMNTIPQAERLELIDSGYANRAHNDLLEFILEAGIAALLLLLAAIGVTVWRCVALLRSGMAVPIVHAVFAGATLGILALHSLVDYPMRSMSLACLAALAVGLLAKDPGGGDTSGSRATRKVRLGDSR